MLKHGHCGTDMPSADSFISAYMYGTFDILNVPTYIIFTVFWRFHMNFSQYLFCELCFASAIFK